MPTPEQIAKPDSESAHQQAVFAHFAIERFKHGRYMETEWLFHIPNGRQRESIDGARLKAEGVRSGVWDLMLPVARGGWHGLFIEMKAPNQRAVANGGLSDNQLRFNEFLYKQNYAGQICYNWLEAVTAITSYIDLKG